MFSEFAIDLCGKLIENEYTIYDVFGDGKNLSLSTDFIILIKVENPILYIVNIVNENKINLNHFKTEIDKTLKSMEEYLNSYGCNKIICLNIIVSSNENFSINDYVSEESITDGVSFKVWWGVNLSMDLVDFPKGQPDKISNIRESIEAALKNPSVKLNESDKINFKEFENQKRMQSSLEKRSVNSEMTLLILFINVAVFFAAMILNNQSRMVSLYGLDSYKVVVEGEYYRLITGMFIHSGLYHIVGNGVYLYVFGSRVEKYYGKMNFIIIYFLSGLLGSIFSVFLTGGISVGASGAIYGLLGAVLVLSQIRKRSVDGLSFYTILIIFFPGLAFGALDSGIDIFGHLGGAIGGYLIAYCILKMNLSKNKKS